MNLSLRKKLFNKYIEPIFEELQPVIKFYADTIATFRRDFSKAKVRNSQEKAIQRFKEDRRKLVQQRSELIPALETTLAYMEKKLSKNKKSNVRVLFFEFMDNLCSYFVVCSFRLNKTRDHFAIRTDDFAPFPASISSGLLDFADFYLRQLSQPESKMLRKPELIRKNLIGMCDEAIEELEKRSVLLHKSFTALKLECNE